MAIRVSSNHEGRAAPPHAARPRPRVGAWTAIGLALLAAPACAHRRPEVAVTAQAIPATPGPEVAVVNADGVRIYTSGDAWNGIPASLGSTVTPLAVRIENHSGGPIRLVYERFALVTAGGREFHPLPLLPLTASSAVGPLQPTFQPAGFFVAPRFAAAYGSLPRWHAALPRDESLYRLDYRQWPAGLPSQDMILKGLPEGVLEDGGSISGFLYFDHQARDYHEVTFRADFTAGDWERRVALIEIPFRIQ
jgi:hypothetical protein